MNSITNSIWHNLSAQRLHRAAALKGKIQSLENQLSKLLSSDGAATQVAPKRRRKMSASARAKIAAAQRASWSKTKGKKSAPKLKKARRKMSAAARAKIAAAAKARWAKARAAGKKRL
ncbi:MAG TPA: hypothetical protein VME24_11925 [Alphaproteobacteria bacterium]|nr:hypothetical protein [Alphaproteobacteria bacterium]